MKFAGKSNIDCVLTKMGLWARNGSSYAKMDRVKNGNQSTQDALSNAHDTTPKLKAHTSKPINPKFIKSP